MGNGIFTSISQPSVSRALEEVVNALNEPEICNAWVKYPSNFQELCQVREECVCYLTLNY